MNKRVVTSKQKGNDANEVYVAYLLTCTLHTAAFTSIVSFTHSTLWMRQRVNNAQPLDSQYINK